MLMQREGGVFCGVRNLYARVLVSLVVSSSVCLVVLMSLPSQAQASAYTVTGRPTVTVGFINTVLAKYNSPAAGKGQTLYDYGVQYGIDPVFAMGFFYQESRLGKVGVATVTLSLGNIRTPVTSDCRCRAYHGYRQYNNWEDGFLDWYKLISKLYVKTWNLTTVDTIVPVYAPSSDNNNVAAYIATVKKAVNTWRSEQVVV